MAETRNFRCESVFNDYFNGVFDESVTPVLLEANAVSENQGQSKPEKKDWAPENPGNSLACSYCRVTFSNVAQQREHYRLDWHRYNLKLSLQSKSPIAEEEFSKKTEDDDVSSISGSDTDEDEQESLDMFATAQGKIFLQNKNGLVFSLYRCLLLDKKEEPIEVNFYKRYKSNCHDNRKWAIFMLGGGHFAGAIFDCLTPVVHKTFHCYTVRAGQGGSQSARDNKSGGSHPKSAGASMRRYNEQALVGHVRNIVTVWSDEIKKSSIIFYRATGPYNRAVLFGGKEPLLDRNDPRLRTIPFSTGRATFGEVKRVHSELSTGAVYESLTAAASTFSSQRSPEKDSRRNKVRSSQINRAKSRECLQRALPGELSPSNSEENLAEVDLTRLTPEDLDNEYEETILSSETLEVSFEDLEEYGDSLTPEQRKKGQHKKKPSRKSKTKKLREQEEARKKNLVDILVKGNVLPLEELFKQRLSIFEEGTNVSKTEIASEFFNEVLSEDGNSFLHLAAMNEHEEMLGYLLENEADPCLKNKNQQTPYTSTESKTIRNALKKFAKDNPEKYNYNKAQIPLNTLTDQEMAEKKKAQKKIKREKKTEKRKEIQMKQREEEEASRFVKLSDREKRALAAERRIRDAGGTVIARCFLCGSNMTGKTPFEYLESRFCTIECLKAHRMKTTIGVS